MRKKFVKAAVCAALCMLAACGKSASTESTEGQETIVESMETVGTVDENSVSQDDNAAAKEDAAANSGDAASLDVENLTSEEAAPEGTVSNQYFSVYLQDVTKVDSLLCYNFVIKNISDITYIRSDDLLQPGDSCVRTLSDTEARWAKGGPFWVHIELREDNEDKKRFYSGGFSFELDEDLNVINMGVFEDIPD